MASPLEARASFPEPLPHQWSLASRGPRLDLLITGVGKANAAGAVARFVDSARHDLVLNLGIAGSLAQLNPGDVVIATASVFADEGLQTPTGFTECAAMGFPLAAFPGSAVPATETALTFVAQALHGLAPVHGPIATVSTCSGTDALAAQVRTRTGAVAEAMEGAAAGLVAFRLGVPFVEVRVISNTTGDRHRQQWDMNRALAQLSTVIGLVAQAVRD